MFRQEMPRIYELRDLITDPSKLCAYFQGFDKSIHDEPSKKRVWLARERELQRLDLESWQFLKEEALPYLMTRDERRGWEQLIAILNQARAHNYLLDEGCLDICFILRSKTDGKETPDLEGVMNEMKVVCEVKTINISDVEAIRRQTGGVGTIAISLDQGFFRKLESDLLKAKSQMESYFSGYARRITFVVLNFDDFFGEYKADYFEQIDRFLATHRFPCLDIVFYNQITAFYCHITMQNAVVVNEGG